MLGALAEMRLDLLSRQYIQLDQLNMCVFQSQFRHDEIGSFFDNTCPHTATQNASSVSSLRRFCNKLLFEPAVRSWPYKQVRLWWQCLWPALLVPIY